MKSAEKSSQETASTASLLLFILRVHWVEISLFPRTMRQFAILQTGVILSGAEIQSESVEFSPAR